MSASLATLIRRETLFREPSLENRLAELGELHHDISPLYNALKERAVELILIEADFPGINAGLIRKLRLRSPLTDIWLLRRFQPSPVAADDGFYDGSISLDAGLERLEEKIKQIYHQKALLRKFQIVGRSEQIKLVAETIEKIAPTDISILIIGPSGSGKELVARAIHENSSRSSGPFVAVNCGALAEGVLESELFGHEKGAFTGSVGKREGLFVQANGGTIFLDEIGETRPDMQVKLLRVLEDGIFYPVGGDKTARSDARVIAATNRDLTEAIKEGQFREDLYFRLGVVKIMLPALYERREDILPLLFHFASRENLKGFTDGAVETLLRYDWPGNVRQLRNFVTRMGALHRRDEITEREVEQFVREQGISQKNLPVATGHTPEEAGHELIYRALLSLGNEIRMLRDLITANLPSQNGINGEFERGTSFSGKTGGSMQDMERQLIAEVLRETGGNRKAAAQKLGIGERTLYRKIKQYHLN